MSRMDVETGSERDLLEVHLDNARSEVRRKVTGLPWELAVQRLGPSATSAAGVVKHLTDVERFWFRLQLDGQADVPFAWSDDVPDLEFELTPQDSLESLLAGFDRACAESREVAARHGLDDQTVRRVRWLGGARPSLRWIYVHMIEETSRHNGHLDIYRELLDGQTDRD